MCLIWFSEQTAIISPNSVNQLVFVMVKGSVFFAVRTGLLNIIWASCGFRGLISESSNVFLSRRWGVQVVRYTQTWPPVAGAAVRLLHEHASSRLYGAQVALFQDHFRNNTASRDKTKRRTVCPLGLLQVRRLPRFRLLSQIPATKLNSPDTWFGSCASELRVLIFQKQIKLTLI
jgi:hypothetical protein